MTIIYRCNAEKVNSACQWLNNYFAMCSNFWPSESLPSLHSETHQNSPRLAAHLLTFSSPQWWRAALPVNKGCCKTFQMSRIKKASLGSEWQSSSVMHRDRLFTGLRVSVWMKTFCSLINQLARLCCDFIASYRSMKRKQTAGVGGWSGARGLCMESRALLVLFLLLVITGKGQGVAHRRPQSCHVIVGHIKCQVFPFL